MNEPTWIAVDTFINQRLVKQDAALENALAASARAELPSISITPAQGKFLAMLASMLGAKNILEVGTLGGYSAIWLARALAPGGKLITLEADEKHATVARQNIAAAGLALSGRRCRGRCHGSRRPPHGRHHDGG